MMMMVTTINISRRVKPFLTRGGKQRDGKRMRWLKRVLGLKRLGSRILPSRPFDSLYYVRARGNGRACSSVRILQGALRIWPCLAEKKPLAGPSLLVFHREKQGPTPMSPQGRQPHCSLCPGGPLRQPGHRRPAQRQRLQR